MRILVALAGAAIATLAGDADRATAMVTVAGGAQTGTYIVRNAEVPCEIMEQEAPRPKHQFEVTIGALAQKIDPNVLTLLMVIVPNADVRGSNHALYALITFGDIGRGTEYVVDTRPGEKPTGSGTVTLLPHGQDATVTFDVTTADSVSYTGAIQCSGVWHG